MGLFSMFKKSPEKSEAAGDAYVKANDLGLAKIEYEEALGIIEKKTPEDTALKERLMEKLKTTKEALALKHLEAGDQLLDVKALDEAENLFSLALSLTEDPELQKALKERITMTVGDISMDATEGEYEDSPTSKTTETPKAYDADQEFEVLCMTLPEEIGQAYQSYGETFKEGYLALSKGDFIKAADKLKEALAEHEDEDTHIPVELATAHINLWQPDAAIDLLVEYLEKHPSSFQGISLLCDLYCDLEQFEMAHDVIDELPDEVSDSIEVARYNAWIYHKEQNFERAEEIFRKALEDSEHDTDVARDLAMTLAAAGKTQEARDLYADMLNQCARCHQRQNPLDTKAYADLSLEMDDYSDKILKIYLTLAKDFPPLRSECYAKASMIFSHNGDEKEAARFRTMAEKAG